MVMWVKDWRSNIYMMSLDPLAVGRHLKARCQSPLNCHSDWRSAAPCSVNVPYFIALTSDGCGITLLLWYLPRKQRNHCSGYRFLNSSHHTKKISELMRVARSTVRRCSAHFRDENSSEMPDLSLVIPRLQGLELSNTRGTIHWTC